MKINEQKLADMCINHGWTLDMHGPQADVHHGAATVKLGWEGIRLFFEDVHGPFGAVNDILRVVETCIEEG